jgi:hypothetical protein
VCPKLVPPPSELSFPIRKESSVSQEPPSYGEHSLCRSFREQMRPTQCEDKVQDGMTVWDVHWRKEKTCQRKSG